MMWNSRDIQKAKGAEQQRPAPGNKELEKTLLSYMVLYPENYAPRLLEVSDELFITYRSLFTKLKRSFLTEGKKGIEELIMSDEQVAELHQYLNPLEVSEIDFNKNLKSLTELREKQLTASLLEDVKKGFLTADEVIKEIVNIKRLLEGNVAKLTLKDMEEEILMNDIKPLFTLPLFNLPVYPGDIILISARTGDGKTTVALNLIMQLIKSEETVDVNSNQESFDRKALYFTYEIPVSMLVKSFAANDLEKPMNDITKEDMKAFIDKYGGNLGIHEGTKFEDVLSYVWLFHPDVFVIDYDQLVLTKGKFESEERRLAYIVRSLKDVAVATKSACILISQINEDGKVRYSREKEHAASIYIHIERPRDKDGDVGDPNTITYKVKKNRYGVTGTSGVLKVNWETRKVQAFNAYEETMNTIGGNEQ